MSALHLFRFEADLWPGLRRLPLAVRYKLDLSGIHLSLEQWQALSVAERQLLLSHPFEEALERARFAARLNALLEHHAFARTTLCPPKADAPWRDPDHVPADLAAECERQGAARVTVAQWRAFPEFGRYALTKLARPGHRNRGFAELLSELRENGLP